MHNAKNNQARTQLGPISVRITLPQISALARRRRDNSCNLCAQTFSPKRQWKPGVMDFH